MKKNLYSLVYENAPENNKEEEYYRKGFEYFESSILFSQMKYGRPGVAFRRLPNGSHIDVNITDDWYPGLVVDELEKSIPENTFVAITRGKIQFLNVKFGLHRLTGPAVLPVSDTDDDEGIANSFFAFGRSFHTEPFDLVYYASVTNKSKQIKRQICTSIQARLNDEIITELTRVLKFANYKPLSILELCQILVPTCNRKLPPFTKEINVVNPKTGEDVTCEFIITNQFNRDAYLSNFKERITKKYNISLNDSRTVKI